MNQPGQQKEYHNRTRILLIGAVLIIAYILLTTFVLRPLPDHFNSTTPAGGYSSDQCQTIWFFWWTDTALSHPDLSLYATDYIYYPHGTGLGYHLCPLTNMVALGFSALTGYAPNAPALFNFMVYFAFVLNGLASFLLIRVVTGRIGPAFIGSLFVTYAPYRLWHLDHLNLLSTGWGLLAIAFALMYFKAPQWRYLIGAVLAIVATFYVSLTNVMIAALFLLVCVIVFARRLLNHAERKRILVGSIIGIVIATILVLPGLLQLTHAAADWPVGWQEAEQHSPDLLDYIMPSSRQQSTGRGEAYLGWYLLGLALVAVTIYRSKEVSRWGIVAAVFLILSLGPTLIVSDTRLLPGLMPYRWLFETVPYFNLARTPTRMIVAAQWALAILVAFALDGWMAAVRSTLRSHWRTVTVGLIYIASIAAIGFEYAARPIPLIPMQVPPVYNQVVSDPEVAVICDLPIRRQLQISNWYMYWQTYHERKAVNGYLTHHSANATQLVDNIATWQTVDSTQLEQLQAVGVDAAVIHQPNQPGQLIRLNEETGARSESENSEP
ncbi:MAG: hypothetical protein GF341_10810 [candidate division Zixibacteria bacterium]|nr:hypothetical protein [candidate division Zixibacteria bacterium]